MRRGPAPFAQLLHAARATRCVLSRDAGTYLCNYAYWHALDRPAGGGPLVQFVHIPMVRREAVPLTRLRGRRKPSLDQLVRAGEAILIALAAARRR
jgi:pyroglutamyl-peptidase